MVENDRENLEESKLEAEAYIAKQRELLVLQNRLYQLHRAGVVSELSVTTEKKEVLDAEYAALIESLREDEARLGAVEGEYEGLKGAYETMAKQLATTKDEFTAFERKDIKLKADIKHLKAQIKKHGSAKAAADRKLSEKGAALEAKAADVETLVGQLAELGAEHAGEERELESLLTSFKAEASEIQARIIEQEEAMAPFARTVNEAQSAVDVARAELACAEEAATALATGLAEARSKLAAQRESVAPNQAKLQELRERIATDEATLEATKQAAVELKARENELTAELRTLRARYEDCKETVANHSASNKILHSFEKLRSKGKLPGYYGRLGDLGTIDDEYDVAISTACGALNHIVVEDTETAKTCVKLLRKYNLGRATFVILSEIGAAAQRMEAPFAGPDGVPRLFDLVEPEDDMFRPAFYFALRDTLVAENLDQATAIAYGKSRRFRVVTLDGKLIDTSGTMSGGGNKVARGGMVRQGGKRGDNSAMTAEEVEALEATVADLTAELGRVRDERQDAEKRVRLLTSAIKKRHKEASKVAMDVEAAEAQIPVLEAKVAALEEQVADLEADAESAARSQALRDSLEAAEADLADAREATVGYQEAIASLQEELANVGGMRVKVQRSKVDSLAAEMDSIDGNITKAKVAVKTLRKANTKLEKEAAKLDSDIAKAEAALADTTEELASLEGDAAEVKASYETIAEALEDKAQALEALKAEYDELKRGVNGRRTVEVNVANQSEDLAREVAALQAQVTAWGKKIEALEADRANTIVAGIDDTPADREPLPELSADELSNLSAAQLERDVELLDEDLKEMCPNMKAIAEYRRKEEEYLERVAVLDTVTQARDAERTQYDALRKRRLDEFMAGFSVITMKLKEMYQMITLGGDAELELVDSLDPFAEGIVFSVRPPKKSWKNISNLSGGEKTLSSLALVFALHHYKPTPLYVMDEIDAALDFKNVSIVANYIKDRTKNAQFIIISLRNNMFELADRLVGIYKTSNATKSITINPAAMALGNATNRGAEGDN